MEQNIHAQLDKIKAGNPKIKLVKPCRIGDGILTLDQNKIDAYESQFEQEKEDKDITFFIPASGSGSRMFNFLFDYLHSKDNINPNTYKSVEILLSQIYEFAFYNKLPRQLKSAIKSGDVNIRSLIEYILTEKGLNLGIVPKGLIPFHRYGKFIINPFQEHIIQGAKVAGDNAQFHFTINKSFEAVIERSIQIIKEISGVDFQYQFSEQNVDTHAYAFTDDYELAYDHDNSVIRRPSGHGALIENLNAVQADLIFIKNIDNIQHYQKASTSLTTKKALGGLTLDFQESVFKLINLITTSKAESYDLAASLNKKYQLNLSDDQLKDTTFLMAYFNRPIRVCGMVKNEGQPGGGPFWISDDNGNISKQIIEKSQISSDEEQVSISLHATHFNPVEIICAVKQYNGQKFDLTKYVNEAQYFLVNKTHQDININYIEQPGLWNGGMYGWLTLFYEIDSKCFSPVKSVLDLLNPLHVEK